MLYKNATKSPKERARDLLARMSIEEKVGQLNQRLLGFSIYQRQGDDIQLTNDFQQEVQRFSGLGVLYGLYRADPWSDRDYETGLSGIHMKQAYNQVQRYVLSHSRLGIPMLLSSECPHGHQALDGYLLPVNLAMGAAWNPELIEKAYQVCGAQLRELGVDYALISMLDILRDPRWGRSEECYSEDPFLASALAKKTVEGCQQSGVAVVAKHFCAQGETTGGINASAARIGGRELREIHLPVMKACCDAGVQGVMAAYNEIDGVFCHANSVLLDDILRRELGFQGIVMADGHALDRLNSITGSPIASAALALKAGIGISLWDEVFPCLKEALYAGLVTQEEIDRAVLAVLELKFSRGLFEKPFLDESPLQVFDYNVFSESLELARQSPVLLKNQGILPLENPRSIAVIGPNAHNLYSQLGDYTPCQRPGQGVTVFQGLEERFGKDCVGFAQGCTVCDNGQEGFSQALELANKSDLIVLVLGGSSSRFAGAKFDTNGAAIVDGPIEMDCGEGVDVESLELPGAQTALAKKIFAIGKPVVTVIIAGRPYAINDIYQQSSALLYAFYPGPMGGKAIGEILAGDRSPSGRLPVSLPKSAESLPCYYNYKSSYQPKSPALFPFGYGMSYTQFSIESPIFPSPISVAALLSGAKAQVRFTLINRGNYAAYAVPQLFIHDRQASTVRRIKELKGFQKVFLKPGQHISCTISVGRQELSLWDQNMKFVLEPGFFDLFLEEGGALLAQGELEVLAK